MNTTIRSLLAVVALVGCQGPGSVPFTPVDGRDDLSVAVYHTAVLDSLSEPIVFEVPEGTGSLLIEVKGDDGLFFLTELINPDERDMVESGHVVTRSSREINGLVDWLFPNDATVDVSPGIYRMLIRGEEGDGKPIKNEEIEVTLYAVAEKSPESCGIHLDFVMDRRLGANNEMKDPSELINQEADQIAARIDTLYRQIGVKVIDYTVHEVDLEQARIDLDASETALAVVGDVLDKVLDDQAMPPPGSDIEAVRKESIHIVFVRSIGSSAMTEDGNDGFNPLGYSMGLPGPYDVDRPNAAVLLGSDQYTDFTDGSLDIDGLTSSLSHELGHYLGLYHTSEKDGKDHDPIEDTLQCSETFACEEEFEFNIMTSAFWLSGPQSKRHKFTEQQGAVIRRHPLCIPMEVERPVEPADCETECDAPDTCAEINGVESCERACTPEDPQTCMAGAAGTCMADDLGTFVCQ